jgi:hypothetical protein
MDNYLTNLSSLGYAKMVTYGQDSRQIVIMQKAVMSPMFERE